MSAAMDSKSAAAALIDPLNAPEPSAETGPGSHFGSTYAPAPAVQKPRITKTPSPPARSSFSSNNPFRDGSGSGSKNGSPREAFPAYRAEAFGGDSSHRRAVSNSSNRSTGSQGRAPRAYDGVGLSPKEPRHRRRSSSLSPRFPGDTSHQPLESIMKDQKKAHRSPHLNKRHLPGPDTIDRLDPAVAGRPYHHEGPYDAALLARNTSYKSSPVAAVEETNQEALKATPAENIKDSVERHKPLDGVAQIPAGMPDRFGRTYNYEEGADLMHEDGPDGPGYKRWAGKDYHKDDLKGKSEPTYSLDRALRNHTIRDDANGIEMSDRAGKGHSRKSGSKDLRDPVMLAGGEGKYQDMEIAATNDHDAGGNAGVQRSGSLRAGLKKRIGSLRKKRADS